MFKKSISVLDKKLEKFLEDKTFQYVDRICREVVANQTFFIEEGLIARMDDLGALMVLKSEKRSLAERTVVAQLAPYQVKMDVTGGVVTTYRSSKGKDEPTRYVSGIPVETGAKVSQRDQAAMIITSMVSFNKGTLKGQSHNADPTLKRYLPETAHCLAMMDFKQVKANDMVSFFNECRLSLKNANLSMVNRNIVKSCPKAIKLATLERDGKCLVARPHKMERKIPRAKDMRGKIRAFQQLIGSSSSGLGGLAESHVDGMFDVVGPVRKTQDRVTDLIVMKKVIYFLNTRDMSLIYGCFNKLKLHSPKDPVCLLFNGSLTEFPGTIKVKDGCIVDVIGDCVMSFPAYALGNIKCPLHYVSFSSPPSQPSPGAQGRILLRDMMKREVEGLPKQVTSYQFYFPMYVVTDEETLHFRPSAFIRKGWGILVSDKHGVDLEKMYHYCALGIEHAVTYAWRSTCLRALLPDITPHCDEYDFTRVSDDILTFDEEHDKLTGEEFFPSMGRDPPSSNVPTLAEEKAKEEDDENEIIWSQYEDAEFPAENNAEK